MAAPGLLLKEVTRDEGACHTDGFGPHQDSPDRGPWHGLVDILVDRNVVPAIIPPSQG